MKRSLLLILLLAGWLLQDTVAQTASPVAQAWGIRVYSETDSTQSLMSFYLDEPQTLVAEPFSGFAHARAAAADDSHFYIVDSDDGMVANRFLRCNRSTGTVDTLATYGLSTLEGGMLFLDMAFSPDDHKLYGVAFSIGEGTVDGENIDIPLNLYTIDTATGHTTRVGTQESIYIVAIAFSAQGTLLGMSSDGTLYELNRNDFSATRRLCQTRQNTTGLQSLALDEQTGLVYWTAITESGQAFLGRFTLQGTAATFEVVGNLQDNTELMGLYIDTRAPLKEAPGAVTQATATPDAAGGSSVLLSWTNPTRRMDGRELTGRLTVTIADATSTRAVLRDLEPGATATFTDEGRQGLVAYRIQAANEAGEGRSVGLNEVFVGKDTPGPVAQLSATHGENYDICLTWSAPTSGQHHGYFSPEGLTYTVVRLPEGLTMATGLTACTFTDNTISTTQAYRYQVTASNSEGNGAVATTPYIVAGPALSLPYECNFASADDIAYWTTIDADADDYCWAPASDRYDAFMKYFPADKLNPETPASDWLLSPPLHLEAGQTYYLGWSLRTQGPLYPVSVRAALGPVGTPAADFTTLQQLEQEPIEVQGSFVPLETTFSVDVTGDYTLGFEARNAVSMHITNIALAAMEATDLTAVALSGPDMPLQGEPATYTVTLRNSGHAAVGDYQVELLSADDMTPLATADGPAIEPLQQQSVSVVWTPTEAGTLNLVARAVVPGDANEQDNTTQPLTVSVQAPGTWRHLTAGRSFSTDAPFALASNHGAAQTIYPRDSIAIAIDNPQIVGLKYYFTANGKPFPGTFSARIYMANTTAEAFSPTEMAFLPTDDFTLVFDGPLTPDGSEHDGTLGITFDQPFSYTGGGLCIYTLHDTETPGDALWWRIYYRGTDETRHTLYYEGNAPYNGTQQLTASQEYPNISLYFQSGTTGVQTVEAETPARSRHTGIFDLQGRRLQGPPAKGLYIVDGQKRVVK